MISGKKATHALHAQMYVDRLEQRFPTILACDPLKQSCYFPPVITGTSVCCFQFNERLIIHHHI